MERIRNIVVAVVAVCVLGFGASEAWAGQSHLRSRDCGDWNWCAPSQGGQFNCDYCCGTLDGGFCRSEAETDSQGCICYAG